MDGTMATGKEEMNHFFEINLDVLKRDIPDDLEGCMDMMNNIAAATGCFNTLGFWIMGRIACEKRQKLPEVIDALINTFRVKKRTLDYAIQLYKRFEDPGLVVELCRDAGLAWTGMKNLAGIKNDAEREETVQKLLDGELSAEEFNHPENAGDLGETGGGEGPEKKEKEPSSLPEPCLKFYRRFSKDLKGMRDKLSDLTMELSDMEQRRETDDLDTETVDKIGEFRESIFHSARVVQPYVADILQYED